MAAAASASISVPPFTESVPAAHVKRGRSAASTPVRNARGAAAPDGAVTVTASLGVANSTDPTRHGLPLFASVTPLASWSVPLPSMRLESVTPGDTSMRAPSASNTLPPPSCPLASTLSVPSSTSREPVRDAAVPKFLEKPDWPLNVSDITSVPLPVLRRRPSPSPLMPMPHRTVSPSGTLTVSVILPMMVRPQSVVLPELNTPRKSKLSDAVIVVSQ